MNDHVELSRLIGNPSARRLWLLYNALHCLPFDRAIDLARSAEAFLAGSPGDERKGDSHADMEPSAVKALERTLQPIEKVPSKPSVGHPPAKQRTRLVLPAEQRDRLLERLTEGAKNAELATEFGLSLQQVQGLRIGCAREIAKRRDQLAKITAHSEESLSYSASMEDIVRYLRQQDDVVVAREDGFLVNGRFQMPSAELVARANRMRSRQGKPAFGFIDEQRSKGEIISSANGHSRPRS